MSIYPDFMFYYVKKSHFNGYILPFVVVVKGDLVNHAKIRNKINSLRVVSAVFYTGTKKNVIKSMVYVLKGLPLLLHAKKNVTKTMI